MKRKFRFLLFILSGNDIIALAIYLLVRNGNLFEGISLIYIAQKSSREDKFSDYHLVLVLLVFSLILQKLKQRYICKNTFFAKKWHELKYILFVKVHIIIFLDLKHQSFQLFWNCDKFPGIVITFLELR